METSPQKLAAAGFDAAAQSRQQDYLNRWPLAREIYGIATTGPATWSIRIGVYGEWGTGKTSVLEFVSRMAEQNNQILVRFNPWEHSTKNSLWNSFVLEVFSKPALGKTFSAKRAKAKGILGKLFRKADKIKSGAELYNDKAGKTVEFGLALLKSCCSLDKSDLEALHRTLNGKRVLVLIDDLDRTAPELVPEILFVLKELMDIPGFAFICFFDPIVVGQVLQKYHPGFGDGLKFLEKIIDYPRWLPTPSPEEMANLAIADAKRYCSYVPEDTLRDVLTLLPKNPRAVRQFIRLLSLIKPQIQRHLEKELNWKMILTANVIKIRHPRLSTLLLKNQKFWRDVGGFTIMTKADDEAELNQIIEKHVDACIAKTEIFLEPTDKENLLAALKKLCSQITIWFGADAEMLAYQMNLAEEPHAVTCKEFNEFFNIWRNDPSKAVVEKWIAKHSTVVERSREDVYRELLRASLGQYASTLGEAHLGHFETDIVASIESANVIVSMIECLVFDLGRIDQSEKQITDELVDVIFGTFAGQLKNNNSRLAEFYQKNETILKRIIECWVGDITPLVDMIRPYGQFLPSRFGSEQGMALKEKLSTLVLPKYATQIVHRFRSPNCLENIDTQDAITFQLRYLLQMREGPLWTGCRHQMIDLFQEAKRNHIIQENVYFLILWFGSILSGQLREEEAEAIKTLLSDRELFQPAWLATIARPLSTHSIARMHYVLKILEKRKVEYFLPAGWDSVIQ